MKIYTAKYLFFLFLMLTISHIHAQDSVHDFLLLRVNNLRDSLKLPRLRSDETLTKAAGNQAAYMANKKKLSHEQTTPKLETVANRLFYFGANRTYFGENVAVINDPKLTTNKSIADRFFESWKNSPGHYANMVNPNYTRMGFDLKRIPQGIYGAQVFASEEISLPKQFNKSHPDWGVKPNDVVCKMLKDNYETMTFANNIQVVNHEVFFFFHDMPFFEAVISDSKDGLAIDIVLSDQLPCSRENQFHISPVFDGQMQQPVYKKELFKNNVSGNPHKMYVKIGEIPENMRQLDYAVNAIVIKNNFNCDYCIPSYINSRLYPLLPISPYWNEFDQKNYFKNHKSILVRDTFDLSFQFSRSNDQFEAYDFQEMQRLIAMLPFVKSIFVDVFASVEGSELLNKELLQKRKQTLVQFLTEKHRINAKIIRWNMTENWGLLEQQVKQYNLQELHGKSKIAVREHFKENSSPFYDSLLFAQRTSKIRALVDTIIVVKDLKTMMQFSKYDDDINYQDFDLSDILKTAYDHSFVEISKERVVEMARSRKLKSNLLATAVKNNNVFQLLDSALIERHFSLVSIDKENAKLVFNYAQFLTQYWYRNFRGSYSLKGITKTITPEQLFELIQPLSKNKTIDATELEKLKFNIHLSGVLYYTAYSNWSLKEKYFDAIVEHVRNQQFKVEDAESLALFFNYFHKFERTVKLLSPYFEKNELSENGLFWLAETSTMIRQKLPQEVYSKFMEAAKSKNQLRYCTWLNNYFQIQRDEIIKQDFCASCKKAKIQKRH